MIRVFVGCAPNHEDAESQAVLEWSIYKHCTEPVIITWMKLSRDPDSPFYGWETARWATPFSGFRWAVPELCNFESRAIYMDSDVIVMSDLSELWNAELEPGKAIMARGSGRMCVSLWDCAKVQHLMIPLDEMRKRTDNHHESKAIMSRNAHLIQRFPEDAKWNCLDGEDEPDLHAPHIKAIHYTYMPCQPQIEMAKNRLAAKGLQHWFDGEVKEHWRKDLVNLFFELLNEAEGNGFSVSHYEKDEPYGDYTKHSVATIGLPGWTSPKNVRHLR